MSRIEDGDFLPNVWRLELVDLTDARLVSIEGARHGRGHLLLFRLFLFILFILLLPLLPLPPLFLALLLLGRKLLLLHDQKQSHNRAS